MKEYIERAAALDICQKEYEERLRMADYCGDTVVWNIGGAIKSLPAADVAEVKHGEWVDFIGNPVAWDKEHKDCPEGNAVCSKCGRWLVASDEYLTIGRYCPNCGALMKEDEHEAG